MFRETKSEPDRKYSAATLHELHDLLTQSLSWSEHRLVCGKIREIQFKVKTFVGRLVFALVPAKLCYQTWHRISKQIFSQNVTCDLSSCILLLDVESILIKVVFMRLKLWEER